ncbi:hypothetical protein FHG87_006336 [Trinorchestia longiramus]|nr:hypothetical protein FHG87_006336 [Trinorchestia longiramus]
MQIIMRWWTCFLLGTCILQAVPSAASSLSLYAGRKSTDGTWPYDVVVPGATAHGVREESTSSDQQGEDNRSKKTSFSGYVYGPSPSGPAFFEGRKNEVENDVENEEREEVRAKEDAEEKDILKGKSGNERADGTGENSESENETVGKTEIESTPEVPSFFKITSRVTSTTSVSRPSRPSKSKGTKELPEALRLKSITGESEQKTDKPEQSSKKRRERTRSTAVKSVKKSEKADEKQSDITLQVSPSLAERRKTAYDHFLSAPRLINSNSKKLIDDETSENEEKSENSAVEVEGDQISAEEQKRNSFFTIASHKTKNPSTKQSGRNSKKHGERKTSDREAENGKKLQDEDERNDNEEKDKGDVGSGSEGEEDEDEEDDEEGSEEEESAEDDSSEEDDGSPAFIVLRRQSANSYRYDQNRESAKHFSLGEVRYEKPKDISDEKLLFLPVIDGKDLSVSTIRALSSQFSRRGEPIHLEYKELKEGVEGYVAELDNSGTEYFIKKLMELITDLDKSDEIETSSDHAFRADSQREKSVRTSSSPFIRVQSPTRSSSSRSKIKTTPGSVSPLGRGTLMNEASISGTGELNDESLETKGTLLPTTIPIEISPVRSSLTSVDERPQIRIKAELVHSANPNSKTRASIKISDEEIKAITNRYSQFLENYRQARARARTPNSQILRENQARKQLSKLGSPSEQGIDSTRLNAPDLSKSNKKAPVEIVNAVPVPINVEKTPLAQPREKTSAQEENILGIPTRKQSGNSVFEGSNPGGSAAAVKKFHSSSAIQLNTDDRGRKNGNADHQNTRVDTVTVARRPSPERTKTRTFTQSTGAKKESKDINLVPLTEPDSVKANKFVLISGVESDSLERNSTAAVAIPSTPITLISKEEASLTQQASLTPVVSNSFIQPTTTLQRGAATNQIGHMREMIRNRLLNILNVRAQKSAAGQSGVRFALEHVDPSQLPLRVLSKMQASRLSNDGVRLADLSSSSHLTDALKLEADNRSEIQGELPILKRLSSNNFLPTEAQTKDNPSTFNAFVTESGASEVKNEFEEFPSSDNILEESQQIETTRNVIVSATDVVDVSSGSEPVDRTSAGRRNDAQLPTHASKVLETQSKINAELTGEIGVPLSRNFEANSVNHPTVFNGENVLQNSDITVSATQESGHSLNEVNPEVSQVISGIQDRTQIPVKNNIISDEAIVRPNTPITDRTNDEPQQGVSLSDIGFVDSAVSDVILNENTAQREVDGLFIDVVSPKQQDSSFLSVSSDSANAVRVEEKPFSPPFENVAPQNASLPGLFDEVPSVGDSTILNKEVLIHEPHGDLLPEVGLPLSTINQDVNTVADSPNNQLIPATPNLRETNLQEILDLSVGPMINLSESLNPDSFITDTGGAAQLQEIGTQIENLQSSPSSRAISKSSELVQKKNLASIDEDLLTKFPSEQTASGKSVTQETGLQPIDQSVIEIVETQTSTTLPETMQENSNNPLMQMIEEHTQAAILDSVNPDLHQTEVTGLAKDRIAQDKETADQPPQVSEITDSILLAPSETLGALPDITDDILPQQNAENRPIPSSDKSVDLKANKITETTIDDEIQKRFQARLMQMIQERANAMLKITAKPVAAVQKLVEDPLTEPESTLSTADVDVTTVSSASELASENIDLVSVTPGTPFRPMKELTIIDSLGSSDSRSTTEITRQPEDEQAPTTTEKAIQDQLQERLNARLMQIIQGRNQTSDASSLNTHNSENESAGAALQEVTTQTSEVENKTASNDSQKSDMLTTEATTTKEKSIADMSDAAIREFMIERFNAGLTTVVHTKGDEVQPSSDASGTEFTTPASQKSDSTAQKINLDAVRSDNDQKKSVLTPQPELQGNVELNTTREIEINDLMNSRLMEILRQRMEDNASVSIAKELGSDTATSTAQQSDLELKGKSSSPENLQTIEQLIAGVEGADTGIQSANGDGVAQVNQENAAIVSVDDVVQPLEFESIPNVRILSPDEITALISNGGSTQTPDIIPPTLDNEVQLSAVAPEVTPQSISEDFSASIALKPLRILRLPDSLPQGQEAVSPIETGQQLFSPRVNIPTTPQVASFNTRQKPLPGVSPIRNSRVLTQEQFLSHLRKIESQQNLGSVRHSQSLLRTSSRSEALNAVQTLGIGGNVVKARRQPGRTQNEVFIQPVARRRRPQPPPTPRNPLFLPAFPNARSAKLLTRLNEDDLRQSSSRRKQKTRFRSASLGQLERVHSLQKSLSNSENPTLASGNGEKVERLMNKVPKFIVRPKKVDVIPQLSPTSQQSKADQHPVVTKAKLQNIVTESALSNSRNSNSMSSIAMTERLLQNVSPPRTTTVKIPLMLARSMSSGIANVDPPRTTAVKIPLMMAKSLPSKAEKGRPSTNTKNRLTTKSSAAKNLRIGKSSSLQMTAQPLPVLFNQQPLTLPNTQSLQLAQEKMFQRNAEVNGQRRAGVKSDSRMMVENQAQRNRQRNSVARLDNQPGVVTVRSRSGNLFTIPSSLFQEFLKGRDMDSHSSNIHRARTLLQTLFVDGERERLKRKAPRVGTVTSDQLQNFMDYIRLHSTSSGRSDRKKRDTDFIEDTQGEEDSVTSPSKKLRDLEKTGHSEEILFPKIVFDDRGTYLTNGKGKNILFQAVDVFYH